MTNLIVCTHGNSGIEMLKSAEMICGKQENAVAFGFLEGENLEELQQKFEESLNHFGSNDSIVVMLDIQGGTPFNVAYNYLNTIDKIALITGVNIPMLIEFFVSRDIMKPEELSLKIVESGKGSITLFDTIEIPFEDDEF